MGIVFRQSIKSTAVIFIGSVVGAIVNYYSTYVFESDLQQFGFSKTIINLATIATVFVQMGSPSLMQIFTQRYPGNNKRKKVLITLCVLAPLTVVLSLLPCFLIFRDQIIHLFQPKDWPYLTVYYWWIPLLVLMFSYLTLFEAYMISQHKTAQGMVIKEVFLRLCNLVVLAALYFRTITFYEYIVYTILSYGIAAILILLLSARNEGFGFSTNWKLFNRKEYVEMLRFSWYHMLMGVSLILIGLVDAIMLAVLDEKGTASVPVYVISVFIVTLTTIPYRAMAGAAFPVLNRMYLQEQKEELEGIFKRSGVNILIVAVAMAMIIGLNLKNAVAILPPEYESIVPLVLILMLGRSADMITGLNSEMISISRYYKFNFRISLVLVGMMCLCNYLLIPRYSAYGAAWATTISLIIFNISKLIYLQKKMGMNPFTKRSLPVLIAGVITAAGVYFIPFVGHPVTDTIIRTAAIVLVYVPLLLWWRTSEDLNAYIQWLLKKINRSE